MQKAGAFSADIVKHVGYQYLLHLPAEYQCEPARRWPLVLFLHGAGERGSDLELVRVHGIPKLADEHPEWPFIAVSPQCPLDRHWTGEVDGLLALLDDIAARHAVDLDRVYVTGLSMGGFGTWALAVAAPERFAAIAPVCGGLYGPARSVTTLKGLPVWAFHGVKDPVVAYEQSERLVKALGEAGGDVRLTSYADAGHDAWSETYANPELYTWLLAQRRRSP